MKTRTRVVLAQAAVAVLVAAWAAGALWLVPALPFAAAAIVLCVGRVQGRPIHRWVGDGIRYFGRRRTLPAGAGGAALLALVRPGGSMTAADLDGDEVGVVEDVDGLAAMIQVGDLAGLLGDPLPPVPPLGTLLPPPVSDLPEVRVQLLVTGVTAPNPGAGASASATSYRQLTDGRVLAHQRVLISIRVRRAGGYGREDLERSLVSAVRRACRLLEKAGLPARPLSPTSALTTLIEVAQHDPAHAVRESWSGLQVGGLHHAVFRLDRWPAEGTLIGRLLALPTAATTVALTTAAPSLTTGGGMPGRTASATGHGAVHGFTAAPPAGAVQGFTAAPSPPAGASRSFAAAPPAGAAQGFTAAPSPPAGASRSFMAARSAGAAHSFTAARSTGTVHGFTADPADGAAPAELTIRLTAPTAAALAHATTALQRLVATADAKVSRLDGAQLDAFAATLPLGGGSAIDDAALAGLIAGRDGLAVGGDRASIITAVRIGEMRPTVGGEGLMLGVNRHGEPVVVRLFRAEPTRAALIGGLRCTEMVVLRALAVGADVIVQSARPHAWEPFLRGIGSTESVTLVPAGQVLEPPLATPAHPQLLVIDVGPVEGRGVPVVESAWRATLLVRDELTAADVSLLARADLALLQPLTPPEAALAAAALGLGDSAGWLTRVSPDMLGLVVSRRTVRWMQLSTTPIELQLTGGPAR